MAKRRIRNIYDALAEMMSFWQTCCKNVSNCGVCRGTNKVSHCGTHGVEAMEYFAVETTMEARSPTAVPYV